MLNAKIKTTKISYGGGKGIFTKIWTSKNFPLYGSENISAGFAKNGSDALR